MIPILALASAQLFDLISFLVLVGQHGLAAELNPLVVRLATQFDLVAVAIAKLVLLAYVACTIAVLARRRPRLAGLVNMAGVAAGTLGGFSNILTI